MLIGFVFTLALVLGAGSFTLSALYEDDLRVTRRLAHGQFNEDQRAQRNAKKRQIFFLNTLTAISIVVIVVIVWRWMAG